MIVFISEVCGGCLMLSGGQRDLSLCNPDMGWRQKGYAGSIAIFALKPAARQACLISAAGFKIHIAPGTQGRTGASP
jgi:hypothetical protein